MSVNVKHSSETVKFVIEVSALFISVAALVIAIYSQKQNLEMADVNAARQDWSQVMNAAMEYPEFTLGRPESAPTGSGEGERYEWYVSNILYRSESVLSGKASGEWKNSVMQQIKYHSEYVCSLNNDELEVYDNSLVSVISQVCNGAE